MEAQNKPVITKEWLANKIKENPERVIGRALVAIFRNQTKHEQSNYVTFVPNGIGFAKPDARVGSIGARQYEAKSRLQDWVVRIWSLPAKDGYPRICKYAGQLQAIAEAKKTELDRRVTFKNNVEHGGYPDPITDIIARKEFNANPPTLNLVIL